MKKSKLVELANEVRINGKPLWVGMTKADEEDEAYLHLNTIAGSPNSCREMIEWAQSKRPKVIRDVSPFVGIVQVRVVVAPETVIDVSGESFG